MAIEYSQLRSELRPSNEDRLAPRAQQRLLHRILGILQGAEHPIAVRVEWPPVRPHQLGERRLIPSHSRLD